MSLLLRPARLADLDAVMALEAAGFAAGLRETAAVYRERLSAFAQGAVVAEEHGQVIGCIFSEIWRSGGRVGAEAFRLGHAIGERHAPADGDTLYVSSMTIGPPARGRGLGARLLARCIDGVRADFPRVRCALLLVNETWAPARRIYQAGGFEEVGRLPGFFRPDPATAQTGIVMRKVLHARP